MNELLAAADRASNELIDTEDEPEAEVEDLYGRYQEVQREGPGSHTVEDVLSSDGGTTNESA